MSVPAKKDGQEYQAMTKSVEVRVRSVDTTNFTVDADVSDETVDRDGEIILLSSWQKRLGEYQKNPLLCWMHPVGGWGFVPRQPEDILGKSILTEVQPTSLFCRFQYAVRENPKAEMCFNLIAGDYLRSYSIGAIPYGQVYCDAPDIVLNVLPEKARAALQSGEAWCVHTDMELLEVSNVFVGSNREALARACRDGVISRSVAPGLFKMIQAPTGKQWNVPKQLVEGTVSVADFASLQAEVKGLRELLDAAKSFDAAAKDVEDATGVVVTAEISVAAAEAKAPEVAETSASEIVELTADDLFAAMLGRS